MTCRCKEHWGYSCATMVISCATCSKKQDKTRGWTVIKDKDTKENRYLNLCPTCKPRKRRSK